MATIKELEDKIAKLEKGINSKATSTTAKEKMRVQVKNFKKDISDLKAKAKPTTSKASKAKEISKQLKRKYNKSRPFGGSDINKDAERPAKPIGKRTSADGNTYYEYRENRTDRKQPPKRYPRLEDGGMMDDATTGAGSFADGGMMARGGSTDNFNPSKYNKGVVLEKSAKASNDNEVYDILNNKWKKYKIVNSRQFDLETPYNRGWIDEGISINVYLLKDTETNKYYWDSDYIEAKKSKMADGGMMAKGGRTSKDWTGRKTKEKFGKYDLSKMYDNNLDLIADVVDYIKDLQKEIGQSYAKEFVYDMMDVLKNGKITYNDGSTLTFENGGTLGAGSYAKGGTTNLSRDRKFKSQEDWEQYYQRKTKPKNPVYKKFEDGGGLDLLADTDGATLQNVGGTAFSNADLTPLMDITNPMFANGGEIHRGEGGMYAKGGMTEHGLKRGDEIIDDQFWENSIVVRNRKDGTQAVVNLSTGGRKESKI